MDRNSRFLMRSFKKYYRANTPVLPDRFSRREFGFMFFDKSFVQRHMSFRSQDDLRRFMMGQVPAHSYYSTSYYRRPDAPTMDEKGWMGAELIFDLDADHLDGAKQMTYAQMLEQIRTEMISLVDNFLLGDLGFTEDQVHITFSGGRGYHAHVRTPDVMTLGTQERRELVDYITCSGLNMNWVFPIKQVVTSQMQTANGVRTNVAEYHLIPGPDSGGWRKRMRNGLIDVVDTFCEQDLPEIRKSYPCLKGTEGKTIMKVKENLKEKRKSLFMMNTMAILDTPAQKMLMKIMKEDVSRSLAGEVDEPVTADIKRLIRLPGSVHGKSGLRVTPISRDELTDFDPLQMAVPDEYSDELVKVTMKNDMKLDMKGEHFNLSGEVQVPEWAAVFLVGRKAADYGFRSEDTDREVLF